MNGAAMQIGKFIHNVNLAEEYQNLSEVDELSADILASHKRFEQACYFLLQAMEKSLRAKIFTKINPNHGYFREINRSHSIEDAIRLFTDIVSGGEEIKKMQINKQLDDYVIKGSNYNFLHNNLRYPNFSNKYKNFSKLAVKKNDFDELKRRLNWLRVFLKDY
ncbi:hypothetical protein ACFBZI_08210 [Moraxella sp. ZJ142]|uniref:hypothetical protein n=1 Tax=Moraxella marmotae TaxID=3344520 RepID=UPI0035D4A05F